MRDYLVENISMLLESGKHVILKYFVTEHNDIPRETPVFGIRIEKQGSINESEDTGPISDSKDIVQSLCMRLIHGQVTPVGMIDVVEDYLTIMSE